MADATPGHARQPGEPRCYNCGLMGHWAVACPEPTRQTPAGLEEALRNTSSHAGQGQSGRDHRNHKKVKGPVITRYAPPQPIPGFSSHPGHYPSQVPYQHPSHYPQPPPPTHYSYSPPTSSYPAPAYNHLGPPVQQPPPTAYGPPGAAGAPQRPDYAVYTPQPPPAPPPAPPVAHNSPPPLPPQYRPPPPRSSPPGSFSRSSPPQRPPPNHPPVPGLPPKPSGGAASLPKTPTFAPQRRNQPRPSKNNSHSPEKTPRKPLGPSTATSQRPQASSGPAPIHGLPPKPPAPTRDRPDVRHDHHNNRKQDPSKGNRDTRHDDQSGNRRTQNKKLQGHDRRPSTHERSVSSDAPPQYVMKKESSAGVHSQSPERLGPSKNAGDTGNSAVKAAEDKPETKTGAEPQKPSFGSEEKSTPTPSIGNAPGRSLPGDHVEGGLLPKKVDAKNTTADHSRSNSSDGPVNPVHQKELRKDIDTDRTSMTDGKSPAGDSVSNGQAEAASGGRIIRRDSFLKRKRYSSPAPDGDDGQRSNSRDTSHTEGPGSTRSNLGSSNMDEPTPSRSSNLVQKDAAVTKASSSVSRRSSVSSTSTHSSGLDSLDRELLGIEPKSRRPSDADTRRPDAERRQSDAGDTPKPKRRRVQVAPAYRMPARSSSFPSPLGYCS